MGEKKTKVDLRDHVGLKFYFRMFFAGTPRKVAILVNLKTAITEADIGFRFVFVKKDRSVVPRITPFLKA